MCHNNIMPKKSKKGTVKKSSLKKSKKSSKKSSSKTRNYLKGPISMTQMSTTKYGGYKVLLFGDHHVKLAKCPNGKKTEEYIQNYIFDIVKLKFPEKIDLFIEEPYEKNKLNSIVHKNYNIGSYLAETILKNPCFSWDKTECSTNFPNLRAHYTDLRQSMSEGITNETIKIKDIIFNDIGFMNILLYGGKEIFKLPKKEKERIYNHINNILDKWTFDTIINSRKIKKQFDNIKNNKLRNKLIEIFKEGYELIYNKSKNESIEELILNNNLLTLTIYIIDIYTLGRFFRSYENTGHFGDEARNSIFYFGNVHIQRFINILKQLGFKIDYSKQTLIKYNNEINKSKKIDLNEHLTEYDQYQCIDITDIKNKF